MATAPLGCPNNLPVSSSSFIGREREIAEIKRLAASTRLVTLTGPGGCGKTRLAIAVARTLLKTSRFDQGIWFVDLSGLDAPSLIPQVMATTLNIPEARDSPLTETLIDFLQPKRYLLVLDNCEHLIAACAELIRTLLEACPHLHLLATSREPLNLPLELTWLVPSLTLPEVQHSQQFQQLAKSEAIQLFVARARAVLPGFTLNEANASIVEHICRRLDGIPLAIELAAARVKLLDITQIATRVDDSLQLLTHGNRAAAPRHQTMRAALDWSYRLLLPREQILFRRLAVFAGGFTLDAMEAVCADPESREADVLPADVLDVLSDLVDKSLALIAEREPGEAVRYRVLEPVRQYALEKLRESDAEAAARDRHLAYFVDFAEQVEPKIKSNNQLRWLKRLDREHDNLRAALAWSGLDPGRAVAGLRLAKALHLFWQRRGYWREGRGWLEQAIASCGTHADEPPPDSRLFLARALVAQGWLAVHQGDYGTTREGLERGLALARALNDEITVAQALGMLSWINLFAGDTTAAHDFARASVESARHAGERWTLAWTVHFYGRVAYRKGDQPSARAALDESALLLREIGDTRMLAANLNTQATITAQAGDIKNARALYEEVLTIGRDLDDRELQIKAAANLAGLALLQGDTARAEEVFEQLVVQARELGAKAIAAGSLRGLGQIRILQNDFDAAGRLFREGIALDQEIGHRTGFALLLAGLSRVIAHQGQTHQAARLLGAIEAFLRVNTINLDADDRAEYEQNSTAVHAAMTSKEFEAAFAAGQALTLEQAFQEVSGLEGVGARPIQPLLPVAETLYLYALGPMRARKGEQALTTWPYAKVKELLFYLAAYPARTKAQIGLDLWPKASPRQLRNSLGITLYHLRRALGNSEWIVFEDEVYRFNRTLAYQFDVEVFEANLAQASRVQTQTRERAITLLQEAITLYQGDFVEDFLEGEWFLLRREELRRKYLGALLNLGQLLNTRGDHTQAAEVYRRAIEKDEVLEEAHRELMRCYARLGERGQALRHYQILEQLMRDELGSAPAAESVALYERLKRGEEI